ncbi:MAG TPA: DUF5916 domain-containing protein [Gemmatimonadales bacterium]|nr:DUF5916 domain-containing protein [Gemmatimonadales bacterium]
MSLIPHRVACFVISLGALVLSVRLCDAQEPARLLQISRVSSPPHLDEFLDRRHTEGGPRHRYIETGEGGLGVAITDLRQREPGDGTPVGQPTTVYLSYDDDNLYAVFVCRDEPAKIRASIARREEIGGDDAVAIYLDAFHDREHAYVFMANPRGVQLDGIRTEGQDEDLSYDVVWQSEGRLTEDGYVVRLAIPFRSLRFPRAPVQTWGVAVGRIIRRNNEESYWPHLTKRVKGFVPQFAVLQGLERISPGRNIQLNPYSTLARARFLDEDALAFVTEGDERVGLDAKVVLRDALTLDATVNPDFSQVETDDPQVTLNERFEVFFPEKRPFFIENAGYFQTPVNLFFSRRVVDPGAGLRLTGKAGRWTVGAIAINDREPGHVPAPDPLAGSRAGVGALRVQRELGEESTIGFLVTDRELEGSFNRMYSLDGRLRFGKNWAFVGQVIRSETRELDESALVAGFGALAELQRDGRHVDYVGRYLAFSPDFAAPLGFVKRTGYRQTKHEWQYKWRPKGSPVVAYGPTLSILYNWDPGGAILDREIGAQFKVELVGQSEIKLERTEAFELFEEVGFRPYETKATLATEWLKWFGLDASYTWGTAVNHDPADGLTPFLGRAAEAEVNVTLRPTSRLRMDQAYIFSRLNTRGGARVLSERLLRAKVNYQFNRFVSLRAIVDYEAERGDTTLADVEDDKQWRADVLLTYLLNPGTAVYVGYTDSYRNLGLVGSPPEVARRRSPDTSIGRQVFVKLSYLLRF